MNLDDIKALCKKHGEKRVVEYKTSTANLRAAFETICAFLNSKGGIVLIGVKDDGKIVGQHVSDSTKKDIAKELNRIEPAASVEVDYVNVEDNRFVIAIYVEPGNHAPYVYDGRAWQREESETQRMSQHRYEQLLVERGQLNHSWEEFSPSGYKIDDLDHDEIRRAVKQGISVGRIPEIVEKEPIVNILKSWKLIGDPKINNAAVVLFAKEVLPQCHLKMARFRGTDKQNGFIDDKDIHANAFRIFDEANNFITRYLPIASFFEADRLERIDKPVLPVLAVREALVNAIVHREYSNRSSFIALMIFDDRMEIWNTGKLPFDLNINNLKKKHLSRPRNENIAKVFYDRKYFDGWGTGISRIFDLCRESNIPDPEYEQYSGGTGIIFKFNEPIAITYVKKAAAKQNLSSRQEAMLEIIKKHRSVGMEQIISELINPPSRRMIQKDLNKLKELGEIRLEGSARNSKWLPKG